jgi:hypothetical protein
MIEKNIAKFRDTNLEVSQRSHMFKKMKIISSIGQKYACFTCVCFQGFVVLYETKKGFRFRCRLINLLRVS